jgi:hypothetical protein
MSTCIMRTHRRRGVKGAKNLEELMDPNFQI